MDIFTSSWFTQIWLWETIDDVFLEGNSVGMRKPVIAHQSVIAQKSVIAQADAQNPLLPSAWAVGSSLKIQSVSGTFEPGHLPRHWAVDRLWAITDFWAVTDFWASALARTVAK
jgi:hypothetical protein